MLELRIAGEMKFAALRDGLQVEFTGELVIESEVPDVDIRIDERRVGGAGAFEDKIGASFDGETIGLYSPDLSEVEIITHEVEMESACGRPVRGAPGDD